MIIAPSLEGTGHAAMSEALFIGVTSGGGGNTILDQTGSTVLDQTGAQVLDQG